MKILEACLLALLMALTLAWCQPAQAPRCVGVSFNGETDALDPLAADRWHTIVASYRYPGKIDRLTNTFLVLAKGNNLLAGLDVGYNLPGRQLMIIKHGFWNATEATGKPGEAGQIIENDQAYMDCEHSKVETTADDIVVTYRLKFKPGALKGICNVFLYIEDRDVNYEGFTNMGTVTIEGDALVSRTDMPAQWRNALKPNGKAAPAVTLAEAGHARYTVLIPAEATRLEKKVAQDLAQHLKLISGAEVAIVSEGRKVSGPFISIGRTAALAAAPAQWKTADLAAEGYALEVIAGNVYLYGGSGRGLIHGVYSLLEEDLGCRWYSTTSVDTPRMERLTVSLVPRKVVPVLELRDPYIYRAHDANWSLRNKTNTPHARIPLAWGGSIRYHLMGHTYATYFPTKQYFEAHPEYYALVNGKRQPSQLCTTNEDVIRLSIEKTCEIFRNHPDVTITGIGPNDGRGFCDCPNCKRLDDENGGRSGSYFTFINRIAAGVKQAFPDNHIIALTYLDYARPPTRAQVDPSVILQLCTDSHAWKYQFCPQWESEEFQGILKAWEARKARMFVWDYTTDYVHYLVPMANWQVVAENTRFMIRHGVTGLMYESEANDNDELRAWVWAKQMWNPALDTKALLQDFIFGYYKEAGAPLWEYQTMVWEYWEKWHKQPHKCGGPADNPLLNNLQCSYAPDGPMFTPEFMAKMRRCFEEAERLARDETIRQRVEQAKLPMLYLELCQKLGYYSEFGDFIHGNIMSRPRAERQALKPELDEFVGLCGRCGVTTLGIAGTVEKVTGNWQACLDAETAAAKVYLPAEWIFTTDPTDTGVTDRWSTDQRYYQAAAKRAAGAPAASLGKGLTVLHTNRGVGWEQQGFPGFDGPGWYFQNVGVPAELSARKHLYLYFMGVNEQAWVYVNGEQACERSYASTGKSVGDLNWVPFSFEAGKWLKPGTNQIAVRVMHSFGLGGICMPAMLVGSDEELTPEQLGQYRYQ